MLKEIKMMFRCRTLRFAASFLLVLLAVSCQKSSSPTAPNPSILKSTTSGNCTFTMGYWKNHNKYADNPSQQIPWPICSQDPQGEDTLLCGMRWLYILQTEPNGNAWYIL